MIEVRPTRNVELVREIVKETLDLSGEDGANLDALTSPGRDELWLIMLNANKARGVIVLKALGASMASFHISMRKEFIGQTQDNLEAAREAIDWIWKHTGVIKLVSTVPVYRKDVLRFAQRLGAQREGLNRKSWRKNNTIHDQYYVGLTKK